MTRSTPTYLTHWRRTPLLLAAICLTGCVQRKLTITSEPSGALVYMNSQEVGRTPIDTDFVYYGKYDVQVRKEGYETFNKGQTLRTPWWQVPPIDFFAEFMPWHPTDHQYLNFVLTPLDINKTSTPTLLKRATQLRGELQYSPTSQPATQPTSQPATQPASRPATQPGVSASR